MPLIINTNSAATMAANNLAASSERLQRSLNRLSSGSKIVNPSDDAGGLAVSMKLSAAARRQGAVMTNLGNNLSFLQTQDGALKVAGKLLDRIGELKTLAQDPTKNSSDLANYNVEFQALQDQLTSIGGETFNGINLFGSASFDVATSEDSLATVEVGGVDLLGSPAAVAWSNVSGASPGADWTSSDPTFGSGIHNDGGYTRFHADGTLTSTQSNISGPYALNFTFSAFHMGSGSATVSGGGSGALDLRSLITAPSDGTDYTMEITVDANGDATWSFDGGAQTGSIADFAVDGGGAITFEVNGAATVDLHIADDLTLTSAGGGGGGNIADVTSAGSLSALNLSTIQNAIQDVASHRATNGAQQSRLGFASELLTVNKANLEAAASRIVDVDVAVESTQLARFNVLVQAGTSMLAQANQSPQSVLKLLS